MGLLLYEYQLYGSIKPRRNPSPFRGVPLVFSIGFVGDRDSKPTNKTRSHFGFEKVEKTTYEENPVNWDTSDCETERSLHKTFGSLYKVTIQKRYGLMQIVLEGGKGFS